MATVPALACYEFGPFRLDPVRRRLLKDGTPVALRPKEFDLLLALIQRPGQDVAKDEGMKRTIVSLRHEGPSGVVDHFAITVESFSRDAVTEQLTQHGLTPQQNVQFGFHIKDPDGVVVQIV